MRHPLSRRVLRFWLLTLLLWAPAMADVQSGRIRLRASPAEPATAERPRIDEPRKGFDYGAFEARLESLWFQRKTFVLSGRTDDAVRQLEQMRAFCAEEGVRRLENVAAALLAEGRRHLDEGDHEQALVCLRYAEAFDPGQPQVHRARAAVLWQSGEGMLASGLELGLALKWALLRAVQNLTLFPRLTFVVLIALFACLWLFAVVMLARHQAPFRHEVEEWAFQFTDERLAKVAGWAALLLPFVSWFGAGWAALYWVATTFRFMGKSERAVSVVLLLTSVLAAPAYAVGVALYGTTADPAVRTTLASVGGEYDPDRIVKLRQLVDSRPDDPVYRFLLAGLYKNGRYFEESFEEYKEALKLDPGLDAAHLNIGNIFYATGQYAEAVNHYRQALSVSPSSFLAHFNMHLAQSEALRFREAEESLVRARDLDPHRVADLLSAVGSWGDRPAVQDASLKMASVWEAALDGRGQRMAVGPAIEPARAGSWPAALLNLNSILSLFALAGCGFAVLASRGQPPARRCVRCGRPFCRYCRSGREGKEYCSQCLHMYVLGDGLAPGTKSRKQYEVRRHERFGRLGQRFVPLALPGAAQLLRGQAGRGTLVAGLWLTALVAWRPGMLAAVEQLVGLDLHVGLLHAPEVPALFEVDPLVALGLLALPIIWLIGNAPLWRRREA